MEAFTTIEICKRAKAASAIVAGASSEQINAALLSAAEQLIKQTAEILAANALDIEDARGTISEVMIDRLRLTEERIEGMAKGIREITALPSPLGNILSSEERPNGLILKKVSVPLGVIAIIYESRPNVTSDAAALALKSGNSCVLKCGKEAHRSARAIVAAMRTGLLSAELPEDAVALLYDTTRAGAAELMTARGFVDLLIPRGGAGLIRACVENATVPCLETGTGICHIYVDGDADLNVAIEIVQNAKTSRPSVCNAAEVCLVDKAVAEAFLPMLKKALSSVELRLCPRARAIIDGIPAGDADFDTEFLDYILAVKVVDGVQEAIEHIATHSTHHSEAIVTKNAETAECFTSAVDSAAVYVNASTRFTDGGEFGLGCEMGISTQKLHARGPVGIKELTTYKFIIQGSGQVR